MTALDVLAACLLFTLGLAAGVGIVALVVGSRFGRGLREFADLILGAGDQ